MRAKKRDVVYKLYLPKAKRKSLKPLKSSGQRLEVGRQLGTKELCTRHPGVSCPWSVASEHGEIQLATGSQNTDGRIQTAEDRRQMTEVRGRRSE